MVNAVFIHRDDSVYDDVPAERYHFPAIYRSRVDQTIGDWIIYLEPSKVPNSRGYFAAARVAEVISDPQNQGMFFALVEPLSFAIFGVPVPFRSLTGTVIERSVLNERGAISGRARAAVRLIPREDFAAIVRNGLPDDAQDGQPDRENQLQDPPARFDHEDRNDLGTILQSRKIRDRNFRRAVLRAYGSTCAFTGLKLINGGGAAEVEAAHIRPVEADGPDIVSNGLALSRTAHWMFDRGLLGIADDDGILISRYVNDQVSVSALMRPGMQIKLPKHPGERPHHRYLAWHRENRFKM